MQYDNLDPDWITEQFAWIHDGVLAPPFAESYLKATEGMERYEFLNPFLEYTHPSGYNRHRYLGDRYLHMEYDNLYEFNTTKDNKIEFNGETLRTPESLNEFVLRAINGEIRYIFIASACGTGKTTFIKKICEAVMGDPSKEDGNTKVLSVVCRQTTAMAQDGIGQQYLTIPKDVTHWAARYNRVICSLDSLTKYSVSHNRYEVPKNFILILDELVLLLMHYLSKTINMNKRLKPSLAILVYFIQHPNTTVICMDALLEGPQIEFFRWLHEHIPNEGGVDDPLPFEQVSVCVNNYFRPVKTDFYCYYFYHNFWSKLVKDIKDTYHMFLEYMEDPEEYLKTHDKYPQICVASATVEHVRYLKEIAEGMGLKDEHMCMMYAAGNEEDRQTAINPGEYWASKFLICYSPIIGPAVSYSPPKADVSVYVLTSTTINRNTSLQQSLRVRRSREINVYLMKDKPNYDVFPVERHEVIARIRDNEQFKFRYNTFLRQTIRDGGLDLDLDEDHPFFQLLVMYDIEENKDRNEFTTRFLELVRRVSCLQHPEYIDYKPARDGKKPQISQTSRREVKEIVQDIEKQEEEEAFNQCMEDLNDPEAVKKRKRDMEGRGFFRPFTRLDKKTQHVFQIIRKNNLSQLPNVNDRPTVFRFYKLIRNKDALNLFEDAFSHDMMAPKESGFKDLSFNMGVLNAKQLIRYTRLLIQLIMSWMTGGIAVDFMDDNINFTLANRFSDCRVCDVDARNIPTYLNAIKEFFTTTKHQYNTLVKQHHLPTYPTVLNQLLEDTLPLASRKAMLFNGLIGFFIKISMKLLGLEVTYTNKKHRRVILDPNFSKLPAVARNPTKQYGKCFVGSLSNFKDMFLIFLMNRIHGFNGDSWKFEDASDSGQCLTFLYTNPVLKKWDFGKIYLEEIVAANPLIAEKILKKRKRRSQAIRWDSSSSGEQEIVIDMNDDSMETITFQLLDDADDPSDLPPPKKKPKNWRIAACKNYQATRRNLPPSNNENEEEDE